MKPSSHYPHTDDWHPPLVGLVGTGMGMDREDLSPRALRWVERAQVLAGGRRLIELFPDHQGEVLFLEGPMAIFLERVADVSRRMRTVVLASGDPLFFGIGRRLVEALGKDRVQVFPNVTTVQALFSRLAEPWEDVKVHSLHGRARQEDPSEWLVLVRDFPKVALFTDPEHGPTWIARKLCQAGMAADRRLVVAQDLGTPEESLLTLSPEDASQRSFSPLNLVAILPVECHDGEKGSCSSSPTEGLSRTVLGLSEEDFLHEGGLITKLEVRAVALAMLQLQPRQVLWDLGAASGSVAIEAARMAGLRKVFAVEKDLDRYHQLVENIRRFQCYQVLPILGNALEMLDRLEDPDRIFIGGSGGESGALLREAQHRLKPGGRIVMTIVTMDTLETARSFLQQHHFQITVTQLQVNRSVPIGKTHRLEALNPVFIMAAWKETEPSDG